MPYLFMKLKSLCKTLVSVYGGCKTIVATLQGNLFPLLGDMLVMLLEFRHPMNFEIVKEMQTQKKDQCKKENSHNCTHNCVKEHIFTTQHFLLL